jgi:hypothetical protein
VSEACGFERQWAKALGKPILPVAVEAVSPSGLPSELSTLQIVDYQRRDEDSAFALSGALAQLDPAPPLPEPMPVPPPPPLSYLNSLTDRVAQPVLTQDQQWEIASKLGSGLRSADPEEVDTAREILERFHRRNDLYANIDRMLADMQQGVLRGSVGTARFSGTGHVDTGSNEPGESSGTHEPGWYADPTRKHEWRWFEGDWTHHVSDRGHRSIDPL